MFFTAFIFLLFVYFLYCFLKQNYPEHYEEWKPPTLTIDVTPDFYKECGTYPLSPLQTI